MIRLIWNLVVVHLREAVFRFRIVYLARLHRENSESLNDADHGDGSRARTRDMARLRVRAGVQKG